MSDQIIKVVELQAPVARVWRALADHQEFGQWFRVKLDGPFEPGMISTGQMTYPGYEHYPWRATVERMEPEQLLSFRWHHFDETSDIAHAKQPTTLVEFRLEPTADGTRLTIIESGFDSIQIHAALKCCAATLKAGTFRPDTSPPMSNPENPLSATAVAPVFAALGDGTRLLLLARLSHAPAQSITELTKGTGLTRQGVSKHLAILREANVVTSQRVGRESLFVLRAETLESAGQYLEAASRQWDEAIVRLRSIIEE